MSKSQEVLERELPVAVAGRPKTFFGVPGSAILAIALLIAGFGMSLVNLVRFALESDLYSYILLVPVVSVYLFSVRNDKSASTNESYRAWGMGLGLVGLLALASWWGATLSGVKLVTQDSLAITTFSFVFLLGGVCAFLLPKGLFRGALFPLVFLLFMIPFPVGMERAIESFLQTGSAPPAHWLFKMAGTPVFRQDMVFQLPGITLQIAPECSGIRSSLVLFMTSLVAGFLFLKSPWKRAILTIFVIPLALARNGLRVFTIGQLCVYKGPHMIDSDIHHKGGPIFFALSLIPFFILIFFLIKSDRSPKLAQIQPSR